MELRQYQIDVIEKARERVKLGDKRIMIQAPTGSGKTEVGIALIQSAIGKGSRVLFCCNRKTLIHQAVQRFEDSGIFPGVVQAENTRDETRQVLICSIQTLARRKHYPKADLIVVDEAHGCTGESYLRLFELWNNVLIIGLSATPFTRGLGKQYPWGKVFDSMVHAISIRQLILGGYLVDADIYAPSMPDLAKIRVIRGEYDQTELGEAVDKPKLIGDIVEQWQKIGQNRPTVCFATNIAHSKHIMESFLRSGISCEHIDCNTTQDDRDAILGRVKSGETTIVTNVSVLCEGWDFPALEVMILARPTKSLTRYLQMAGRILRPCEGKEIATIIDHSGAAIDLGHPCDDQEYELDDGSLKKKKKKKKYEKKPSICPKCHFLSLENPCPKCGTLKGVPNSVSFEDGDLVALGERSKATKDEKQDFFSQLIFCQGHRQDGWVKHKYREHFGVWPLGLEWKAKYAGAEVKRFIEDSYKKYKQQKRQEEKKDDGIIDGWQLGD